MLVPLFALSQDVYMEPDRPLYHFTAKSGWLNDPNGLVYFNGEYHLFFQHNPSGTQWGNMTWGHAVSRDLVHWKQVENALEPDATGTMFSGSAVVDKTGSAGLGEGALVLLYTAAGGTNDASKGKPFTQCLASSLDGRTFTKLPGNPVLPHIEGENRDPKVVWYAPTKSWVMALYLADDRYALFGSPDLLKWTKLCDVQMPGTGECPDFFELPVFGEGRNRFWVFSGANGNYRLGRFDGQTFTPVTEVLKSHWGKNSYAAQTYFNEPRGRRVQFAWMQGSEFPKAAWNQQMSIPRKLAIRRTALGERLTTEPAEELKSLRAKEVREVRDPATGGMTLTAESPGLELRVEVKVGPVGRVKVQVGDAEVSYDAKTLELTALGSAARVSPENGMLALTLYTDRASLEVFAQYGLVNMPFFHRFEPNQRVSISVEAGARVTRCDAWELGSCWDTR